MAGVLPLHYCVHRSSLVNGRGWIRTSDIPIHNGKPPTSARLANHPDKVRGRRLGALPAELPGQLQQYPSSDDGPADLERKSGELSDFPELDHPHPRVGRPRVAAFGVESVPRSRKGVNRLRVIQP